MQLGAPEKAKKSWFETQVRRVAYTCRVKMVNYGDRMSVLRYIHHFLKYLAIVIILGSFIWKGFFTNSELTKQMD